LQNGQTSDQTFQRADVQAWNTAVSKFEDHAFKLRQQDLQQRAKAELLDNWKRAVNRHIDERRSEQEEARKTVQRLTSIVAKDEASAADATAKVTRTAKAVEDAKKAVKDAEEEAGRLNTSEARDKASDRRSDLSSAVSDLNSANYDLREAQRSLADDKKELGAATDVVGWVDTEWAVMKDSKTFLERMWSGTLWYATATAGGTITRRPQEGSAVLHTFAAGDHLSVLPISSDWCVVLLQNGVLGWTRRSALKVANY
jgi:hypothetical protein